MSVYARHGIVVRLLYLTVAGGWHLLSIAKFRREETTVVLCYHGVLDGERERFRRQVQRIADWSALHVGPGGPSRWPGRRSRCVRITFDDAFENLLENALPILAEFGVPAVVFAVPGNLGRTPQWDMAPGHPERGERIMTAEQLRAISGEDVTIGSHSQTHADLTRLSVEALQRELTESRVRLEEFTGRPVRDLALPYGACNDRVVEMAHQAGYERIYTLEPRVHASQDFGGVIGRFSMSPDVWPIEFYLTCKGAYVWLHVFRKGISLVRSLFRRRA